jgi:hypothetical protein
VTGHQHGKLVVIAIRFKVFGANATWGMRPACPSPVLTVRVQHVHRRGRSDLVLLHVRAVVCGCVPHNVW